MHQDLIDVKYVLTEIEAISKVKGDRIVQFIDSWIDSNDNIYIKMELCSDNLKNILDNRRQFFGRDKSQAMNALEYHICSHVFTELLSAVNHLHDYKPFPIMHRDLKPANILFDNRGLNGVFFKLCDFGLAKIQTDVTNTRLIECNKQTYFAPEVMDGKPYDTKSDIYSLGKTCSQVFDIDCSRFV